ncbi:hypothetical protein [Methylomonas koyamae]|uniref:hypothetical protein n=1 Tax=Methylomonas koyamae TaxID=702114 RepID=UPI00211020AA|nr:hypothetical protein [Methylomonas koyamae]
MNRINISAKSPINLAISGLRNSGPPNSPISQPINRKNSKDGMPTLDANLLEKTLINNKQAPIRLANSTDGIGGILYFGCSDE